MGRRVEVRMKEGLSGGTTNTTGLLKASLEAHYSRSLLKYTYTCKGM